MSPNVITPLYLSVRQAARMIGVSERTARRLIDQGKFPTEENPVQVHKVGGRLKVPTCQIERVAQGLPAIPPEEDRDNNF